MPLEAKYARKASAWELTADLAEDWRLHQKTYCFAADNRELELGSVRVRFHVAVFPRPSSLDYSASCFPSGNGHFGDDNLISYSVSGTRLKILIYFRDDVTGKLNLQLPWDLTENRKLCLKWSAYPIAAKGSFQYELQLLVTLTLPPRSKPADVRDFDSPFLQGGLPETNRRTH